MGEGSLVCARCGQEKPAGAFPRRHRGRVWRQWCRACQAAEAQAGVAAWLWRQREGAEPVPPE